MCLARVGGSSGGGPCWGCAEDGVIPGDGLPTPGIPLDDRPVEAAAAPRRPATALWQALSDRLALGHDRGVVLIIYIAFWTKTAPTP
jgi:hypothetical protein